MLINAVPLICQQRLALALLNPSGYTVNPSCTCRTSYSRAAWCSTLYYSRCTHSHPAARSAARGTPASTAASPAYVRARSSPPFPCTTRVRDPLQMLPLSTGCAHSYAACCCSYTWSKTVWPSCCSGCTSSRPCFTDAALATPPVVPTPSASPTAAMNVFELLWCHVCNNLIWESIPRDPQP